jgi:hypothetical protein
MWPWVNEWILPDFLKEDGVLSLKKLGYCTGIISSVTWLTKSLAALGWKPDANWVSCFQWFLAGTVLAYVGGKVVDKFDFSATPIPKVL